MAKEQDQTQQTEEDKAVVVETKEDTVSTDKAIETSKDFDKLIDENPESVEETPPEEDDKDESKDSKEPEKKDDTKADDKDTGKVKDEVSEKSDDKATSNVSEELAKRADDVGLSEDEIGQFADEADLEKTVKAIEAVTAKEEAVVQEKTTQTPAEKKEVVKTDTGIKFENEEDIDPEILKAFRSQEQQNKELRESVDKLTANVQAEQQSRQQESQKQFIKRFDGFVDGLGLDFADVLGKGPLNELNETSRAYKNRTAIGARMHAFGKGLVDAGQDLPDEKQLFDLAVNSLHKQKVETSKGLRLGKKTTARSKQRLGRAATKKAGSMTGQQKAVATSLAFDEQIDTSED